MGKNIFPFSSFASSCFNHISPLAPKHQLGNPPSQEGGLGAEMTYSSHVNSRRLYSNLSWVAEVAPVSRTYYFQAIVALFGSKEEGHDLQIQKDDLCCQKDRD